MESKIQESILVEFMNENLQPVALKELGASFLINNNIEEAKYEAPFRVKVQKTESKSGNPYYAYEHHSVPLPTGLDTNVKVENVYIPLINEKSKQGNQMKTGKADIIMNGEIYTVKVYISKTTNPYFINIVAHKKPQKAKKPLDLRPKGGSIF